MFVVLKSWFFIKKIHSEDAKKAFCQHLVLGPSTT